MLAILSLFVVITLSILVTRVATVMLAHTGLSTQSARFQARSAFTGAGFTTNESELVVNHPVRRRIIQTLILLGNAGIVTAVSSLILTFVRQGDDAGLGVGTKVAILVAGIVALWALASSLWVDRRLSHLIDRALRKYTKLDVRDYSSLMHLAGDYRLVELEVEPHDWIEGKSLAEAELRDEGIVVLGVRRPDGRYLGAPKGPTRVEAGDTLVLYGRVAAIEELDERRKSWWADREHEEAIAEQQEVEAREAAQDEAPAAEPAREEPAGPRA